jgi:hypothetical protein
MPFVPWVVASTNHASPGIMFSRIAHAMSGNPFSRIAPTRFDLSCEYMFMNSFKFNATIAKANPDSFEVSSFVCVPEYRHLPKSLVD